MANEFSAIVAQLLFGLYFLLLVLRFLCRLAEVDFYNPLTQQIVRWTQPAVSGPQKILPVVGAADTGSLFTALMFNALAIVALSWLAGDALPTPDKLLLWSLLGLAHLILDLYFFMLLAVIVLSWVAPTQRHPAIDLLNQLSYPIMAPLQRLIPPVGGLDLSPIALFVVINLLQRLIIDWANGVQLPARFVLGI